VSKEKERERGIEKERSIDWRRHIRRGSRDVSIPNSIAELIVIMNYMPYVRIASIAKCKMRSAVYSLLDGV